MTTLSDELRTRIQQLPFADRIALLVGSILRREREAFSAVAGLVELIVRMSAHFGVISRFRIAEALRAAADKIEHEHTPSEHPVTPPLLNERN